MMVVARVMVLAMVVQVSTATPLIVLLQHLPLDVERLLISTQQTLYLFLNLRQLKELMKKNIVGSCFTTTQVIGDYIKLWYLRQHSSIELKPHDKVNSRKEKGK